MAGKGQAKKPLVVFACPTLKRPYQQFVDAMRAAVPLLDKHVRHKAGFEVGNPYISAARAALLRRALNANADIIVFLDHDLSFPPEALLKLILTEGDVVAGLYRFKTPSEVKYMGRIFYGEDRYPVVRKSDGAIKADRVPAGFLKVTRQAVQMFMRAYPELIYGDPISPHVDLFNHGAHEGVWWGEDYAFSRRWNEKCGDIWVVPDLDLTHHDHDAGDFPGNFHKHLLAKEPWE